MSLYSPVISSLFARDQVYKRLNDHLWPIFPHAPVRNAETIDGIARNMLSFCRSPHILPLHSLTVLHTLLRSLTLLYTPPVPLPVPPHFFTVPHTPSHSLTLSHIPSRSLNLRVHHISSLWSSRFSIDGILSRVGREDM